MTYSLLASGLESSQVEDGPIALEGVTSLVEIVSPTHRHFIVAFLCYDEQGLLTIDLYVRIVSKGSRTVPFHLCITIRVRLRWVFSFLFAFFARSISMVRISDEKVFRSVIAIFNTTVSEKKREALSFPELYLGLFSSETLPNFVLNLR